MMICVALPAIVKFTIHFLVLDLSESALTIFDKVAIF